MSTMANSAVRLSAVTVRFAMSRRIRGARLHEALKSISLQLDHGQKLGIVGTNGAGKSTLMKVLAGVLLPDEGSIERSHGPVQLLSLGLGFVPHLTGRQNAVLSGLMLGMRRKQVVPLLNQIKEFSELGDFFDEPIATYSNGMRARLGFSVAIQSAPDLFLIDETLSVGDPVFQRKAKEAIHSKLRSEATVVLVSHSASLLKSVCDRVLWIEQGKTVMEGEVGEVMAAYAEANAKAAERRTMNRTSNTDAA